MNIKRRLIFSNTVAVIIPLAVTLFLVLVFSVAVPGILHKNTGFNNFKENMSLKTELADSKSGLIVQKPEIVEDNAFQKYMLDKLSHFGGLLVITKGEDIIYSSKDLTRIDVEKCIDAQKSSSLTRNVKIGSLLYTVEAVPLNFKDKTSGRLMLLAPAGEDSQILKWFIIGLATIFIVSFAAVNIAVSYSFSKRILKPVELLKNAAREISSGNLSYEIVEAGDEEIMELCRDFERMRVQLKDSITAKIKYDDNRTMLVSSISHDLKTPITSIKGYVEGILDGVANTPEKLDSYLRTVYSKAELIDALIDDLLLYSKLDLNQLPFNFERTDVAEYFNYCIYDSEVELSRTNIAIRLENNLDARRYITIDRDRMRRVIMNIIDNSRKYMNKPLGEIVISLRETNSSIIIEIRDNGAGIDKNDVNKIFDRFYRGDTARTDTKGTGLGLAIAKQIVEGHQGRIWAKSHDNEGASILISLAKQEG